jgi:response regulator RpfG family c-di-GMP phosphodiesterase
VPDDTRTKERKPSVFIVDDSSTIRGHLSLVLSNSARTVSFSNGEDAYKAAVADPPDVIVSDVLMEPIDGYEFCRRVRANPDLSLCSFLLLTAADDSAWADQGLAGGADDFLAKPVKPPEFVSRIHALVRLHAARKELKLKTEENLKLAADLAVETEKLEALQKQIGEIDAMKKHLGEAESALAEKSALLAKAEGESAEGKRALSAAEARLSKLQAELAQAERALGEARAGSGDGAAPAVASDAAILVDVELSTIEAIEPSLDAISQAIHQLMNAVSELDKPAGDPKAKRALLSSARTGYAAGLNELDRIRNLLHEGPDGDDSEAKKESAAN